MLILSFLLAASALFFQGVSLPRLPILAFSPLLALAAMKLNLLQALSLAAFSGAILDLFSEDPIGLHALNYVLITAFLYKIRRPFSFDNPFHLSFLTVIASSFSTALQALLLFLFERKVGLSGLWLIADIFLLPLLDGFYSFVWFSAPLALFEYSKKKYKTFLHRSHS